MTQLIKTKTQYKLFALLMGIVVWFYVMGNLGHDVFLYNKAKGIEHKTFVDVPVKILHEPMQLMPQVRVQPENLSVSLLGPRKVIRKLAVEDIAVYVDLSGFEYGSYTVLPKMITPDEVKLQGSLPGLSVNIQQAWLSSDVVTLSSELLSIDPLTGDKSPRESQLPELKTRTEEDA